MKLRFDKFQGCGNDFIIIDNIENKVKLTPEQIKKFCDRHYGIGADGLILLEKKDNLYYMNYFNADGSCAEMCGNGLRCLTAFILKKFNPHQQSFLIKCSDGIHKVKLLNDSVKVTVSLPQYLSKKKVNQNCFDNIDSKARSSIRKWGVLSVGNPHLVLLINNFDDFSTSDCKILSENFIDNGINVNLVLVEEPGTIRVKTYERGDGFTLACGTGACASASFINKIGLGNKKVNVILPGGKLEVNLDENELELIGPAQFVYQGEVEILEEYDGVWQS